MTAIETIASIRPEPTTVISPKSRNQEVVEMKKETTDRENYKSIDPPPNRTFLFEVSADVSPINEKSEEPSRVSTLNRALGDK